MTVDAMMIFAWLLFAGLGCILFSLLFALLKRLAGSRLSKILSPFVALLVSGLLSVWAWSCFKQAPHSKTEQELKKIAEDNWPGDDPVAILSEEIRTRFLSRECIVCGATATHYLATRTYGQGAGHDAGWTNLFVCDRHLMFGYMLEKKKPSLGKSAAGPDYPPALQYLRSNYTGKAEEGARFVHDDDLLGMVLEQRRPEIKINAMTREGLVFWGGLCLAVATGIFVSLVMCGCGVTRGRGAPRKP